MSTSSLASCNSDGTSSLSLGSRENLSHDKCPRCRVHFDFLKRVNVSKIPLILDCKHTVCEDCIRRMSVANALICPICKEKFTVLRNQIDNLTELFQPHYTLIGQLVWGKNSPSKSQISFVSSGQTLGNKCTATDLNFENTDLDSDDDYEKTMFIFDKCEDHKDEYLNIQCDECDDKFCCYCFLENHAGHKATYLYKLSESEKEQLEKSKADLEIILAQVLVSKKKVKDLSTFDSTSVETEVKHFFTELHAKLHVAERNIRKKLLTMDSEEADLDMVNATLKSTYSRINQIMNNFKLLNTKQLNVRALYEEILELRDVPCCLISDLGALRPIEFVADRALDNIEDSITLKSLPPMCYTLESIQDWSEAQERYEMELMRQQTELRLQEELKDEAVAASKTFRSESDAKRISEGKIRVCVTHINNLNSFYVQRYSALDSLKDMNAMISRRNHRRSGGIEFKIGGVYGVYYETKNSNHWRRGKVIDIVNHRYKIFFIDYGNTQYVTKEKLKELDIRSVRRQNFAQECKLTNPDNINFDPNAHLRLPQIIGEKELYLRYVNKYSERGEAQEVDLLVAASNGGFISVRDLLTKSSVPVPKTRNFGFFPELKLFQNSKEFAMGQEEQVIITYIRDPFYICVQLAENRKILEKMKNDMETYYKTQVPITRIPVEDTDVVVKYEDEAQGNYHRAKILSVDLSKKQVDVLFVDWGFQHTVPWNDLRELIENFIKVECQGILLKLADVEKFDTLGPWSRDATNFLREQVALDEQCRMLVKKEKPLEAALFQPRPSGDICLNSLLVEHKHAVSTGIISQTVCWPNVMKDEAEGDEDDLTFQLIKKSQDILVDDEDDSLKTLIKHQIRILNFKTPDLIYFKFNKHQREDDDLHQQLQIHYASGCNDVKQTKNSWKQGEKCVIFDSVHNNYFRAVIVSKSSAVNYLVNMFDYARELKVSKNYIFVYDKYFDSFRCHAYKCRLANIKPAGDAGTWSQLSIEMLQKIFAKYKTVYIRRVEVNYKEKIMGVIMWYCLTIQPKALEPSKLKFISINQTLIENGVAFSTSLSSTDGNAVEEEFDCDDKSGDESIKSATDKDENDKEGTREEKQDWYEMVCKDEESHMSCEEHLTTQNAWPKPFPIQKREFDAILTCIEDNACLFIRDADLQSLYLDVEEKLTSKLNSMEAALSKDWTQNDMCTIFYEGNWYRGTVLKVISKNVVSVEMIDFGSEHQVSVNDISKYIMLPEFPPLVYKIQLYDVTPKLGSWTPGDIEDLLQLVTDKIKVVIKGDLKLEIPYAEVYLENGLSMNDLITKKCPHLVRYANRVVLGGVATDDMKNDWESTKMNYIYDPLPKSVNGKHKMFIVNVLKWDTSYNAVMSSRDVTKNCNNIDALTEEIEKHIKQQPSLEIMERNEPCVCLHPGKKIWSRALIYNDSSLQYGYVIVFFVDYGSVEMIPVSHLKEMRVEWFNIPVHMRIAKINIDLSQSSQAEFVLMQLNKLREKFVPVEIVSETPLKVHLYESDGKTLFYLDFVKKGIVKNSEL